MTLKLNGSSSGSVSIDAPASTTDGADITFKLPVADGSSGQALTTNASGQLAFATVASGKVLQMIQTTKKDVESVTVSHSTWESLDFQASITPSAATSKIRFQAVLQTGLSSTHGYFIQVYRSINGGAAAALTGYQGDTNGNRTECSQANSNNPNNQYRVMAMDYIDDISSWTSGAITYYIYGHHGEHIASKVMYINRGGGDSNHQQTPSPMSTITLTEISA